MREIKFRAWDKRRNSWFKEFWVDMRGGIYGIGDLPNNFFDEEKSYIPGHIEVNQYTGLKDKNGVEIYEGDIGEYGKIEGTPFYAKVIYHKELARYMFEFDEGHGVEYSELCDYDGSMPADWFEVIGNIYQNPELLKEIK